MTNTQLIAKLKEWHGEGDPEIAHSEADNLLLEFINDPEVTDAFNAIERWYA